MCPSIVVQRGVRKELDKECSDVAKVRDKCVLMSRYSSDDF
jgi:hypothetical protein